MSDYTDQYIITSLEPGEDKDMEVESWSTFEEAKSVAEQMRREGKSIAIHRKTDFGTHQVWP